MQGSVLGISRVWSDHAFLKHMVWASTIALTQNQKLHTHTQFQMQEPILGLCRVWSDHTFLKYWRYDLLKLTQTKP